MATVTLGNLKFNWKGTYNAGTAYAIDDVVSYNGSSYVAKTATTGNLPTVTANWDLMSQKGTDADLLNITSTAQGDIYYNNGSAIARLAAGTAGYVLQTGGSGANPSWTAVSSDCVKLASADAAGAADIYMDNVFSDTYRYYELVYGGLKFSSHTNGAWIRIGARKGGASGANASGTYYVKHNEMGSNKTTNTNYATGAQSDSAGFQIMNTWNLSTDGSPSATSSETDYAPFKGSGTVKFFHPNSITKYKLTCIYDTQWNDNGHIGRSMGIGYLDNSVSSSADAITGLRINCEGHNIAQGFFDLYGYKT